MTQQQPTRQQALSNLVELRAKLHCCAGLVGSLNSRQTRDLKTLLENIESYLTTPIKYLESEGK